MLAAVHKRSGQMNVCVEQPTFLHSFLVAAFVVRGATQLVSCEAVLCASYQAKSMLPLCRPAPDCWHAQPAEAVACGSHHIKTSGT